MEKKIPEGQYATPTEIGQYILAATQLERGLSQERRRAQELETQLETLRTQHEATVKALILEHQTVNEFRARFAQSIQNLETESTESKATLTRLAQQSQAGVNLSKALESRFNEHHHALSQMQEELKALQPLINHSHQASQRLDRLETFSKQIRENFLKEAESVRKYLSWARDQIQFLRTTTQEHTEMLAQHSRTLEGMRSQFQLEHSMTQEQVREKLSQATIQLQKMAVTVEGLVREREREHTQLQSTVEDVQKRTTPWIETLRRRSEELEQRQKAFEDHFKLLHQSLEKLQTTKESTQLAERKKLAAEHALMRQEVLSLRQELKEMKTRLLKDLQKTAETTETQEIIDMEKAPNASTQATQTSPEMQTIQPPPFPIHLKTDPTFS